MNTLVLFYCENSEQVSVYDTQAHKVRCIYTGIKNRDQVETLADELANSKVEVEIVENNHQVK